MYEWCKICRYYTDPYWSMQILFQSISYSFMSNMHILAISPRMPSNTLPFFCMTMVVLRVLSLKIELHSAEGTFISCLIQLQVVTKATSESKNWWEDMRRMFCLFVWSGKCLVKTWTPLIPLQHPSIDPESLGGRKNLLSPTWWNCWRLCSRSLAQVQSGCYHPWSSWRE